MKANNVSFHDLNQLRKVGGVIVTPEATSRANVNESVGELAHIWATRLEYAKALIAAGVDVHEVLSQANALTIQDHKTRLEQMLTVFGLNSTKPTEGLLYAATVLGLDGKAIYEAALPKTENSVNLHG